MRSSAESNGFGADSPCSCGPSSIAATSRRVNQRASSSSLVSMTMSLLLARAKQPIISDDGNGHGCDAK